MEFKIGDKVLFRSFNNNRSTIPTIINVNKEVVRVYDGSTMALDCTILFGDGNAYTTTFDKLYKPDERTIELFGKDKWEVDGVKRENGYFGAYSLIEYKGKKAIVFCDDRDAIVKVVTDWYDEILYNKDRWSGDYRWNSDKPVIVYDKEKGYALNEKHVNKLITPFMESLTEGWRHHRDLHDYVVDGIKDGKAVYVTAKGNIIEKSIVDGTDYEEELAKARLMSIEDIKRDWIGKGKPCAHVRGLEFKGACRWKIDKDTAMKLIQTHTSFSEPFESVEWVMNDGEVTLLFRDYCDSDYD